MKRTSVSHGRALHSDFVLKTMILKNIKLKVLNLYLTIFFFIIFVALQLINEIKGLYRGLAYS